MPVDTGRALYFKGERKGKENIIIVLGYLGKNPWLLNRETSVCIMAQGYQEYF